jgi:hypothetical protein
LKITKSTLPGDVEDVRVQGNVKRAIEARERELKLDDLLSKTHDVERREERSKSRL